MLCPHCDIALTDEESRSGRCPSCRAAITSAAPRRRREFAEPDDDDSEHAAPLPSIRRDEQKMTAGQKVLVGAFVCGILFLIVSALFGDMKSIRAVGSLAGIVTGACIIGGIAALIRRLRR